MLEAARIGHTEELMTLLTPLNVNCHAADGRKVMVISHETLATIIVMVTVNTTTSSLWVQQSTCSQVATETGS